MEFRTPRRAFWKPAIAPARGPVCQDETSSSHQLRTPTTLRIVTARARSMAHASDWSETL